MFTIDNSKKEPVLFNWVDGKKKLKLQIVQMSIGDRIKLDKCFAEIFKLTDDKKLSEDEQNVLFMTARIVTAVKTEKGEYFFKKSLEETVKVLGGNTIYQLTQEVMKLNQLQAKSLDEAKK